MKKASLFLMILFAFAGCNRSKNEMVITENFGKHQGKKVFLLTLTNRAGNVIKLTNYGARVNWIEVPDRMGIKDNITFGFETFEGTLSGDMSFGSTIGRYANRIANGRFTLDGIEYNTPKNNGPNTLHGGPNGWHSVVWTTEVMEAEVAAVKFSYVSPDMEEGFPGTVNAEVIYTWTDDNEIIMGYKCTTDKKTIINVTNHAYFNLHGAGSGDILDHEVFINASAFTPVDSVMIPTGEIRPVAGTPFDFKIPYQIGARINENHEQLITGGGYDHNYILDSNEDDLQHQFMIRSAGDILKS
jgi:aldose 1-epimerase